MVRAVQIAARFRGPPESGNGGYCAGVLAAVLGGCVEVTLRKPPPLDAPLTIHEQGDSAQLKQGDTLIAEARRALLELTVPSPPSLERARSMSAHYVGHLRHHFPTCFVCGPGRAPGDGLRIFPGADRPGEPVAAPWQPESDLADVNGEIRPQVVWAALDCVGYFASAAPDYPVALLGRITAEVTRPPRAGEACVVMGWSLGREGRKLHAGTAVFGADGSCCGRARQTWILLST